MTKSDENQKKQQIQPKPPKNKKQMRNRLFEYGNRSLKMGVFPERFGCSLPQRLFFLTLLMASGGSKKKKNEDRFIKNDDRFIKQTKMMLV